MHRGTLKNVITIKVDDELHEWFRSQPNGAEYIRQFMRKDMEERKPKE